MQCNVVSCDVFSLVAASGIVVIVPLHLYHLFALRQRALRAGGGGRLRIKLAGRGPVLSKGVVSAPTEPFSGMLVRTSGKQNEEVPSYPDDVKTARSAPSVTDVHMRARDCDEW